MTLALGTTTTTLAWAQLTNHGDTVSSAAKIIGPDISTSAQTLKEDLVQYQIQHKS